MFKRVTYQLFANVQVSNWWQVKSSQWRWHLTDTGYDERLCPYHSWNTTTTFQ